MSLVAGMFVVVCMAVLMRVIVSVMAVFMGMLMGMLMGMSMVMRMTAAAEQQSARDIDEKAEHGNWNGLAEFDRDRPK